MSETTVRTDATLPGSTSETPFVGRTEERARLEEALTWAKAGRGATWIVEGPGGMGKTTLLRSLQETAERQGFRVLWGYSMKEVITPFFPLQQLFGPILSDDRAPATPLLPSALPSLVLFEEPRPLRILETAAALSREHPLLLVGRDRGPALRKRFPALSPDATVLQLSRDRGPETLHPGDVDTMAEVARGLLESRPGAVFVLTGTDYLLTQTDFAATLHLVEFLRDLAEAKDGHVILSVNPEGMDRKQLALLEGGGLVVGGAGPSAPAAEEVPSSPTATMIRYQDVLEREAARQPLLLALDDLQWADPASLRAFQFLARNIRRLPVLLLATYRTDDTEAPDPVKERALAEVLAAVQQEGTGRRLRLSGFSAHEALDLAAGLLGAKLVNAASDEGVRELMRRSEGNPYFLKETMSQMLEEGYVRREPGRVELQFTPRRTDGGASETIIPLSLRRLVGRRIDRLGDRERDVLRWAAIAGSQFDQAPLEGVVPAGTPSLPEVILRLEQREHLIDRIDAQHYSFGHPLVWEVTLLELSSEERAQKAARLAQWWSERRPDDLDTISRFYHEAGRPDPGLAWTQRAIRRAIEANALDAVERYHAWLQDLFKVQSAPLKERVEAGLRVVDGLSEAVGNSSEAVHILHDLLALQPEERQVQALEAYLALNAMQVAPEESRALRLRAEELSQADGIDPRTRAIAMMASTNQLAIVRRFLETERMANEVNELGETLPAWLRVRALYRSGHVLARRGALDEARSRMEQGLRIAEAAGVPMLLGYCYNLGSAIAEATGEVQEHRKSSESALRVVRRSGAPLYLCLAIVETARGLVWAGYLDQAEARLAELRKQAERFRVDRVLQVSIPHLQGVLALRSGRPTEAVQPLEGALRWMEEMGDVEIRPEIQCHLAEALLATGKTDRASALVKELLQDTRELDHFLAPLPHLLRGRVLALSGDRPGSREEFEHASKLSLSPSNVFNQGWAANHLAAWEEAFGSPEAAASHRAEAGRLFDRIGVLPEGWVRRPLSLVPPAGG